MRELPTDPKTLFSSPKGYYPLRDAFNGLGQRVFDDVWTGEEADAREYKDPAFVKKWGEWLPRAIDFEKKFHAPWSAEYRIRRLGDIEQVFRQFQADIEIYVKDSELYQQDCAAWPRREQIWLRHEQVRDILDRIVHYSWARARLEPLEGGVPIEIEPNEWPLLEEVPGSRF